MHLFYISLIYIFNTFTKKNDKLVSVSLFKNMRITFNKISMRHYVTVWKGKIKLFLFDTVFSSSVLEVLRNKNFRKYLLMIHSCTATFNNFTCIYIYSHYTILHVHALLQVI